MIILPIIYIQVPAYSLLATIGLIVAVIYTYYRLDENIITFKNLMILLLGSIIPAMVFSRIMYVIALIPQAEFTFSNIFIYLLNGGIVFYGGLLGLLFGIWLLCKIIKLDSHIVLDFIAPSIPLFHSIARIGCLLSGCCYGIENSWGVVMYDGTVRFPVQLFESLCDLGIFIFIVFRYKKKGYTGSLKIYLILYSIARFVLEFFRGDQVRGIWFGILSTAQIVSLVIIAVLIIRRFQRTKRNTAVIAIFLVFSISLTSCGIIDTDESILDALGITTDNDSYPNNASSVVTVFFNELVDGGMSSAIKYVKPETELEAKLKSFTEDNMMTELANTFDCSEDIKLKIRNDRFYRELVDTMRENMFRGYQVVEEKSNSDTADVFIVGASILSSEYANIAVYLSNSTELINSYYYEHQEEMDRLAKAYGDDEMMATIFCNLSRQLSESYISSIKTYARYMSKNYTVTVCKIESEWKIVSMVG